MATPAGPGGPTAAAAQQAVTRVQEQTWATRIPVHLSLAPDNISSPSAVRPIYLMAPRQGYLNVLAAQAWPHLQHVLPSVPGRSTPRPWFDCCGVPLKWHLPCGVLYDLLNVGGQLPWRLTVHYTHPPDSLAGWETGATPLAQFMNCLKESSYVCRGPDGAGAVMRTGSSQQEALWGAVGAGDLPAYRAALGALKVSPQSRQGQVPNIPVRLLLRRPPPPSGAAAAAAGAAAASSASGLASSFLASASTAPGQPPRTGASGGGAAGAGGGGGGLAASVMLGSGAGGGGLWESCITATSRPVPALQRPTPAGTGGDGAPTTLGQLLQLVLPHIFPPPPASSSGSTAAGAAAVNGAADPAAGPGPSTPAAAGAGAGAGAGAVEAGGGASVAEAGSGGLGGAGRVVASAAEASVSAESMSAAAQGAAAAAGGGGGAGGAAAAGGGGSGSGQGRTPNTAETGAGGDAAARGEAAASASGAGAGGGPGLDLEPEPGPAASAGSPAAAAAASAVGGGGGGSCAEEQPQPAASHAAAQGRGGVRRRRPPGWPARFRVTVGGVSPPLEAPIGWLHATMHAPDLFLYVVVRLDVEEGEGEEGEAEGETDGASGVAGRRGE
ncbi:hypothetical protein HYH02_007055 [Chlamydomonas schloesseri]|uniref:Autophagy protein 5 n=1 Tax=Chlamydomonas schloesseri TaxID=2026947 RepID=A0A836B5I6_9CHLO|nr:hypothetical protein HYH02_007055 [Chlamydomonas schloesseri]|eukprot:KAG2448028.1 hypothetical protein HYH02_007055 [Chlamydomonas schloesseri]